MNPGNEPEIIMKLLPTGANGFVGRYVQAAAAREAILGWADSFEVVDSTWAAFQSALDLSVDHGLQVWDALILSVAAESRCRLLLSEDLQPGFTWRGVTVVNPFATPHAPLLGGILGIGRREK